MDGSNQTSEKATQTSFRPLPMFSTFRERYRSDTSVFSTISNFSNFSFRSKDKRRSNSNNVDCLGVGDDKRNINSRNIEEIEEFV